MKFSVLQKDIVPLVRTVSTAIDHKPVQPILNNLRLTVRGERLSITGSDTKIEMQVNMEMEERDYEEGDTTVPASKFLGLLNSYPEDTEIDIAQRSNQVVIETGSNKSYLATLPSEDYPIMDNMGAEILQVEMTAQEVQKLIKHVSFAMATDDVRYVLNGMLFEFAPGHVRTVAANGHRLSVYTVQKEIPSIEELQRIILPRKSVKEIEHFLLSRGQDSTLLHVTDGYLKLRRPDDSGSFITKLISGSFPNYESIIPEQAGSHCMSCDSDTLRSALRRASVICGEKYNVVDLSLKGQVLQLTAHNLENETSEDEISVEYDGEGLGVRFNVSYLQDILDVSGSRIQMNITNPDRGYVFLDPDDVAGRHIIMPIRV